MKTTTTMRKPLRAILTCVLAVSIGLTTMAAGEGPVEEICDRDYDTGEEHCWMEPQPAMEAPYGSLPQLTGTMEIGSTLTAVTRPGSVKFDVLTYEWLRDGNAITGATTDSYKLTDADIGKTMGLRVRGEARWYEVAGETFTAETPVRGYPLSAGTPRVSGTKQVGSVLTVKPGNWTVGTKFSYRWLRNGTAITGANASNYKLTEADRGTRVTVKVTGAKPLFVRTTKHVLGAAVVAPSPATLFNRTLPAIAGKPVVGSVLKATPGTWSKPGVTYKYQWLRDRKVPIAGATRATYKVTAADVSLGTRSITVKVYASKPGLPGASALSAPTGRPQLAP